jgi:hypothetical protein
VVSLPTLTPGLSGEDSVAAGGRPARLVTGLWCARVRQAAERADLKAGGSAAGVTRVFAGSVNLSPVVDGSLDMVPGCRRCGLRRLGRVSPGPGPSLRDGRL